jgi:hypothetical protein
MPEQRSVPTRSILIAGLLGGLLGGLVSFIAIRTITPASPAKPETPAPMHSGEEARQVAESFLGHVRDGKPDQLAVDVKNGVWLISEQEYASFLGQFAADRMRFTKDYGEPTGQFELVRDVRLSPSLVRLIYLEKYQRDGVLWFLVLYHTMDGWRLIGVTWKEKLAASLSGLD